MTILTTDVLQWLGCITGVIGSFLLALNTRHSGWGFVFFLVSNAFWVEYGLLTGAPGLTTNQVFFTATSSLGIYRWLLVPKTGHENNNPELRKSLLSYFAFFKKHHNNQ